MMKKCIALLLALALAVCAGCAPANGPADSSSQGAASEAPPTLTFAQENTRGNTNGNLANMGLGVVQDDWILFLDLPRMRLFAMHRDGSGRAEVLRDVQDMFLCMNLLGERLHYVSYFMQDVNLYALDGSEWYPLLEGPTYCLLVEGDTLYYVDEGGDGGCYAMNLSDGQSRRLGSHAMYDGSNGENGLTSFSVEDGYFYYIACDDEDHVYRVELATGAEEKICDVPADRLIVQDGVVYTVAQEDGRLYRSAPDGSGRTALTEHRVGAFNVDAQGIVYLNLDDAGQVWSMGTQGENAAKFCDAQDVQYITLLDTYVMLYSFTSSDAATYLLRRDGSEMETLA